MKKIKGVRISPGVTMGPVHYFERDKFQVPQDYIRPDEVDEHLQRYENAIRHALKELEQIRDLLLDHLDEDHAKIIDAQLMALNDSEVKKEVTGIVKKELKNVSWAYFDVMTKYETVLEKTLHSYLQERYIDLKDVKKRILHHLSAKGDYTLPQFKEPAIYVSTRITPSELIHINQQNVLGVITQIGGYDSHAGILARSFQIPYLSNIADIRQFIGHENVILDVDGESAIIDASEEEIRGYREKARIFAGSRRRSMKSLGESKTKDGIPIQILLNTSFVSEVTAIDPSEQQGIGLYRTEFLCIEKNCIPDEDEQFVAYTRVVRMMNNLPVTFRTFDFGRDKLVEMLDLDMFHKDDFFQDFGGIRFCLENPELLRTQLKALLRASAYGPIQIMFPMVFSLEEVLKSKEILRQVAEKLDEEDIVYDHHIPIGIMIETEEVLGDLENVANEVDFFSVGTNDLSLFLLGTSRETSFARNDYHPLLYGAIEKAVRTARQREIGISVCGEMASDPLALLGLLAVGIRVVSINPSAYQKVFEMIQKIDLNAVEPLAEEIREAESAFQVYQVLKKFHTENLRDGG